MKSSSESPDEVSAPPDQSTVILLLRDIGSITWRMFGPTIAGLLLGVWVDSQFGSTPWGIIVGLATGLTITVVLMRSVFKKL